MTSMQDPDSLKKKEAELRQQAKPDVLPLMLELTDRTLRREIEWEPTTANGFVTTVAGTTFRLQWESDDEPPYPKFLVFAFLNDKGREIWRETGPSVHTLYTAVKRMVHDVDEVIENSLQALRSLSKQK